MSLAPPVTAGLTSSQADRAAGSGSEAPLQIMASIKPLALLAEAVLGDRGQVDVLLRPGQTPHHFAFRVSDRQQLERAQLLLWVGPEMEPYLAALAGDRPQLAMASLAVSAVDNDKPLRKSARTATTHHGHHAHPGGDPHLWLDPRLGAALMRALAEQLARQAPEYADEFRKNARQAAAELTNLQPYQVSGGELPYAVDHQAYDHFLAYFRFPEPLVLAPVPEVAPGARRLWQLGGEMAPGQCLLVEVGNRPRWLLSFATRHQLRIEQADIMGYEEGVGTYYELLDRLRQRFLSCVNKPG